METSENGVGCPIGANETMADEFGPLGEVRLHAIAAARLARGGDDPSRKGIPLADVAGCGEFDAMVAAEASDSVSDGELFE